MTLRTKIEAAIASANGDATQAGINVCLLLEDTLSLSGNGWFDDDAPLQAIFEQQYQALLDRLQQKS